MVPLKCNLSSWMQSGALSLNIVSFQNFHVLQTVPTPDNGRIVG